MTAKLLPRFKQKIQRVVLVPSDGGRFEVSVGGKLLYSKLEKRVFPDESKLIDEIARALGV